MECICRSYFLSFSTILQIFSGCNEINIIVIPHLSLPQGNTLQFFIILLLVFCLQLAAAVLAYSQQEFIRRYIDQSMYRIVQELYATQPAYKELFDNIQSEVSMFFEFLLLN